MKSHTKTLILILSFIMSCFLGINSASALTYRDNLDVSFTFDSSISVSLSSDNLTISSLSPDTYADSNIVTVTTSTNNPSGYTLTATTGNSETYTNTNLIDSTNIFTSLSTSDSISSMSSANASQNGRWGYSFSTNGTSWKNATGGTGYSGLPYYTASGAEIAKSTTNGTSNVQFKIGAKASTTQSAGTYKNVINFMATANPPVTRHYTVNYIDTSGESVENMPTQQTGIVDNDYVAISDNVPYVVDVYDKAYNFTAWCTEYVYPNEPECSGEFYDPGNNVPIPDGTSDVVINLYTWWEILYDSFSVDVLNDSDASVLAESDMTSINVDPNTSESVSFSRTDWWDEFDPRSVRITVEPPLSCLSTWEWSADIFDSTYQQIGTESGSGWGQFYVGASLDNYEVTITGNCV